MRPPPCHRVPAVRQQSVSPRELVMLCALLGQWENRLRKAAQKTAAGDVVEGEDICRSVAEELAAFQADLLQLNKQNGSI